MLSGDGVRSIIMAVGCKGFGGFRQRPIDDLFIGFVVYVDIVNFRVIVGQGVRDNGSWHLHIIVHRSFNQQRHPWHAG